MNDDNANKPNDETAEFYLNQMRLKAEQSGLGSMDSLPFGRRYNWERLLKQLSQALLVSNDLEEEPSPSAIETEWLGLPGASEAQIQKAEARLGTRFPPSYREFLQVTNGWGQLDSFIYQLWSAEQVEWFPARHQAWIDVYADDYTDSSDERYFVYGAAQDSATMRPSYLPTTLDISPVGDSALLLLNPQVVTAEGEWEAWFFATWLPGATRYRSFWDLIYGRYRNVLELANLPVIDNEAK